MAKGKQKGKQAEEPQLEALVRDLSDKVVSLGAQIAALAERTTSYQPAPDYHPPYHPSRSRITDITLTFEENAVTIEGMPYAYVPRYVMANPANKIFYAVLGRNESWTAPKQWHNLPRWLLFIGPPDRMKEVPISYAAKSKYETCFRYDRDEHSLLKSVNLDFTSQFVMSGMSYAEEDSDHYRNFTLQPVLVPTGTMTFDATCIMSDADLLNTCCPRFATSYKHNATVAEK